MKKILLVLVLCFSFVSASPVLMAAPPKTQPVELKFGDSEAPDQVPSNTNVTIKVKTDAKFVSIKARKSLFEVAPVFQDDNGVRNLVLNGTSKTIEELQGIVRQMERVYKFTGPDGKYLVEITQFDPVMGIKEEAITVIIGELDPALVSLMCDKESVVEGKGQIIVTARLTKSVDQEVTVTPNFGGTATLFEDYDFQPKACCISIPAGQTVGTATITPLSDGNKEGEETVILSIEKVTNAKVGSPNVCNFTIKDEDSPPPPPPVDDLEAQIAEVLKGVSDSVKNEMVDIRQPDGNTISKKAVHAIGQQYGDIAREVKKNPNAWDIATMVDESKVRVGGVIPSSSMSDWLGFFQGLTKLQRELDTSKMDEWIKFFEAVEKVLTEV